MPWANALSIRSAAMRGGFDQVILHHEAGLARDEVWDDLHRLPGFAARVIDAPALIGRSGNLAPALLARYTRLRLPAARSNLLRALLLATEGGVYLDMDTITLQPLTPLREAGGAFCGQERVIWPAWQPAGTGLLGRLRDSLRLRARELCRVLPDGWRHFRRIQGLYPLAANNAVLGAEPGHPLLQRMLTEMARMEAPRLTVRFSLGVHLLQTTLQAHREADVQLLPPAVFYPLPPVISHHWFRLRAQVPALSAIVAEDTLLVHWYASSRIKTLIPRIDPGYVRSHADRQLFSALALPFLGAREMAQ